MFANTVGGGYVNDKFALRITCEFSHVNSCAFSHVNINSNVNLEHVNFHM